MSDEERPRLCRDRNGRCAAHEADVCEICPGETLGMVLFGCADALRESAEQHRMQGDNRHAAMCDRHERWAKEALAGKKALKPPPPPAVTINGLSLQEYHEVRRTPGATGVCPQCRRPIRWRDGVYCCEPDGSPHACAPQP